LTDNAKSQKSEQLPTLKKQERSKSFLPVAAHSIYVEIGESDKESFGKVKSSSQTADTVAVGSPSPNHNQQLLSRGNDKSLNLHALTKVFFYPPLLLQAHTKAL